MIIDRTRLHTKTSKDQTLVESGYIDPCNNAFVMHSFNDEPSSICGSLQRWHKDGILHRDNDRPAVMDKMIKQWYQHGKIIRYNGPAIIERDTILWWSCDGTSLSEKEYWIEIMNKY
jgi:hypothetical protein